MTLTHMGVPWEVFWIWTHMGVLFQIHFLTNLLLKSQYFLVSLSYLTICFFISFLLSGKVNNIFPDPSFSKPTIHNQKRQTVKSLITQKTQPYPKSKAVFIPSQQIHTNFPIIQKQDHPKRISRKKLFLKERKKEKEHVFVTLEKFWKKHFGVFTKF